LLARRAQNKGPDARNESIGAAKEDSMKTLCMMFCFFTPVGCASSTTTAPLSPPSNMAGDDNSEIGSLKWKEFTIESFGIRLSAMLPADSELTETDKYKAYMYRNSNPVFVVAVGIDVNDEMNSRYPLVDPEGEFAYKLIERNKKSGDTYDYVKRTTLNGFTGTEALRFAKVDDAKEKQPSTISRVFYLKRTAVIARVLFDGKKLPEEISRKLFDSLKIEAVGPYREEPVKNK
jgi:hypothetical protein